MKNKIKFIGIIAIVAIIGLSMTSCEEIKFGGSLTIKNNTNADMLAYASSIASLTNPTNILKTIEKGKSYTWDFDYDLEVTYSWGGLGTSFSDMVPKKIYISGGKKETLTAN